VNNKTRKVSNFWYKKKLGRNLQDYSENNERNKHLFQTLEQEFGSYEIKNLNPLNILDHFYHWAFAIKKVVPKRDKSSMGKIWKVSLGAGAKYWDYWQTNGIASIGWEILGDVSKLSHLQFKTLMNDLTEKNPDLTKRALNQVWKFSRIKVGDRIVANRGINEILCVGTVTEPYSYNENAPHGHPHQLKVDWDDMDPVTVHLPGWKRTICAIEPERLEQLLDSTGAEELLEDPPFSPMAFRLLGELRENPSDETFASLKESINEEVKTPFKRVFKSIASKLPTEMVDYLVTENSRKGGLFSRFRKNNFGRGGVWPFYWGAFYPKEGYRIEDAQLFMGIHSHGLEFGFHIGDHGGDIQAKFFENLERYQDEIQAILESQLQGDDWYFGNSERLQAKPSDIKAENKSLSGWLASPKSLGPGARIIVDNDQVQTMSESDLIEKGTEIFSRLFPFVLLANSKDPMRKISHFIEQSGLTGSDFERQDLEETENEVYSFESLAQELKFDDDELSTWLKALERKKQMIFYGPPGTGKTFTAEKLAKHLVSGGNGFIETVQFHPAYTYEEFIVGLRPVPNESNLSFEMTPGRFMEFCNEARSRSGICVLIVDEINRANLSRVFGELMYLLEYRDKQITLAGSKSFSIPHNVRIIGTMNTADRSIALLDHALRRRFSFVKLSPRYEVLQEFHSQTGFAIDPLISVLVKANDKISNDNFHLGISYFLKDNLNEELEDIWRFEVFPYLEEYFFDSPRLLESFHWSRIEKEILGKKGNSDFIQEDEDEANRAS
jgi:5-methylcytosine-specific restriction protein B